MKRIKKLLFVSAAVTLIVSSACLTSYFIGQKNGRRIAVDFSVEELETDTREPKYKMLPAALSNYICDLSAELELDSDLVVAILMVENPEFNPDAISRPNQNGTLDLGMFQLNDYYLWTEFKNDYWFENIELNPFNWKHNTYIALHHMKYLDDKFKVQEDAIMAYNCGEGNVMNGTIPASTKVYLAKVKNNLYLLKGENNG